MPRQPISKSIRFEVFKRDSFKCQYCGKAAPEIVLHVDHISPVALGGDNDITNLITSCEPCNLGKGARALSDHSTVMKSKAQLDELQERREQLEMLMAWRNGLKDIKQEAIERVKLYWSDLCASRYSINEHGEQGLKKAIQQFSINEVIEAMDRASDSYLEFHDGAPTKESVEKAFGSIGGICRIARLSKDKPYIQDLYYSRGILRKRINYCNSQQALEWMEAAISWGATTSEIRQIVLEVRNWAGFSDEITWLIERLKAEGRT